MKKFTRIISLLLVLCMVLSVAPAITIARAADADADLWVDPVNGNDANDGTTESTALKTIQAAKTKAAELSASGDVVVILKEGTYDATETITFGSSDSGQNGNTITYRAASGETALISGGEQLDGWTLHDAEHNIYVTDIPEGAELIRQFYVDGEPQPMASTELTPKDLTTFTSSGYRSGIISSADNTHYLTVDLGEGKLVSSVTLYGDHEASPSTGKALGFPKDFTIKTSADGYSWTTQVTETDYSAPSALGGVEFNFSSTAARYIKIEATELGNPGTNSQTGGIQYRLAFSEVQVGFTSKANSVNLGVAQHVDMDSSLASASNVTTAVNTPYTLTVSSSAVPVGGISAKANSVSVGTTDNIKIQVTTDGSNWQTVYTRNGYVWKQENTFAFNATGATKVRIINAAQISLSEITVLEPATLGGSITSYSGSNAAALTDGKLTGSFSTLSQTSSIYKYDITINLGSVQAVGGVRLYPTYNGTKATGYMTAARILISTDGTNYDTALELPSIQTPTGGAQTLVFPRGYNAQYIKIQPLMLTEGTDGNYSLKLDELEVVPSKIEAINIEDDVPNIVTKTLYENVSWSGATPILGYYADVNDMSGTPTYYASESESATNDEANCVINGNPSSRGWTGLFTYDELVAYGGTKVPAFYVELASAATFNSVEIVMDNDVWGGLLDFAIQAYNGSEWVEIVREPNATWTARGDYTGNYEFDAVTATAVRVLAYNLAGTDGSTPGDAVAANPAGYSTRCIIAELTLSNATEITYEEEPDLDADTVVYDKVSLSGASILNYGYYNNTAMDSFTSYNNGSASQIVDGNNTTYGATHGFQYQWIPPYGSLIPSLVINAVKNNKPSRINAIELVVREDGLCAPYDFEIQVTTSATTDNWTTIAEGVEQTWKTGNVALYKIPEMEVYKVRLVCTKLTPASNIPESDWDGATTTYLHINELSLYNINDPTNPIATDLVSQGEGTTGSVIYDARGATSSSEANSYYANRAVDGIIEPLAYAGLRVSSDAKYNFSYLKNPEHVEMHSLYLWYHRIQHITGASLDGTELYMADGLGKSGDEPIMPTWLSNDYLFIDTPGEWYIDRYEGKIYYMADGTMDNKVAYLPVTDKIIDMEYASNITFEGITFSHTSWTYPSTNEYRDQQANGYLVGDSWTQVPAGIDLTGCTNVIFDGVQIRNMGTAGIRIKSDGTVISDGCQIINSLVCDISYSGIVVGEIVAHHGYRDWQLVKNATVQNNFVTRIGIDMFDSVGIFAAFTNGLVIDHNEVSYTPYSGISLGWGWDQEEVNNSNALTQVGNNKVTYNYVHDVCRTNYDGGAIYTLGWQEGSEIAYNYIHDSGSYATKTENAIYLDEGTAYMEVHHNVIDTVAQSWLQIWFDSIHDNNSHDNYYNSTLSTRGIYTNYGNTTENNYSFSSLSSNSTAQSIANSAGLTDDSVKSGEDTGFIRQHNIGEEYWGGTDYARYINDSQGWYNVRISGQEGRTYYDNVNYIATIVMPEGTDLSSLSLQYATYSGWSVSPSSGTTQDFSDSVTYTLTSSSNETRKWTVNVVAKSAVVDEPAPPVNDDATVETIPTEAPTEPPAPVEGYKTGTYLQIIPESSLAPYVGEYQNGDFDNLVNQIPGEAVYLTDVSIGTAGWIGNANASGTNAAVIEVTGGSKLIGGVELIARQADYLKTFDIEVQKTDGTWVTVKEVTADPFDGVRSVKYTWDPIEATAIRVLCYSWSSTRPMLQEITVYEAVEGTLLQEVVPNSVTANKNPLSSEQVAANMIDGTRGDYGYDYYQTNQMPVAITFDTTNSDGTPRNIARMITYAYTTNKYAPGSLKLEAQIDSTGTWKEIYNDVYYDAGATETKILDFDAVDAYAMRLTVNNSLAQTLILTEVDFFGYVSEGASEDVQLSAPTGLTVTDVTDSSITVTADTVTGGTLKFRLLDSDGAVVKDWQTSGSFTGLSRYTKYTVEAKYVGSTGYLDSIASAVDQRTEKTQLPDVTGLEVVEVTADSITVTADSNANGTLQFRIDGGSWKTGNTFTGLTENTTYKIEARYRGATGYANSVNFTSITATTAEAVTVVVGASYSIHLIEPWALRTDITFATTTTSNPTPSPIALSNFSEYGVYAIIGNKFDGTTADDLMADPDAVKYTSASGTTATSSTTFSFDFYDGLYSYNLDESVYWVAYYVDSDGTYYTTIQEKSLTAVAESLLADSSVSQTEKAVLQGMQSLKNALTDFRGADADLGNTDYPDGVDLQSSGVSFGQGGEAGKYLFGTTHQIRLIEPWGIRVRVLMRDVAANAYVDYDAANVEYGVIFYHDKTGAYTNGMSVSDIITKGDAQVYNKGNDNAWIAANGVNAIYDKGIYTYELDTNLYCLPYVVVDGVYYYRSSVICWNLLTEMETFSQDTTLSAEEIAVFEAMLDLYEKTMAHRNS